MVAEGEKKPTEQIPRNREIALCRSKCTKNKLRGKVSATPAPRHSTELLDAYKALTKYSEKLASFAADPSDVGVTLIRGLHETNAIQGASEPGVADVLGDREVPLSEIAHRVGAYEYRLRTYLMLSRITVR